MSDLLSIPSTSGGGARSGASSPRSGARTPLSGTITPLASQVGGHDGVQSTSDGSLIIKPALPAEAAFYQRLAQDGKLEELRAFTPKFLGTLTLEEQASASGEAKGLSEAYKAAQKEVRYSILGGGGRG